MNSFLNITTNFPAAGHWFLALLGFALYQLIKLKGIPLSELNLKTWANDNLISVIVALTCLVLCLVYIPQVYAEYDKLDSILLGSNATWIVKALLKKRENKLINTLK